MSEASKGTKNPEDAKRRQETQFRLIFNGTPNQAIQSFGPRDAIKLSENGPQQPEPGTFKDPAELFRELEERKKNVGR